METRRRGLVFALDVGDLASAKHWLSVLGPYVDVFKVGLELFTAAGRDAVQAVREGGRPCFLDLKLHDIPVTVARTVEAAARLGAQFLTIHAAGGPAMIRAAVTAARGTDLTLFAVTVLTSIDREELFAAGEARSALERTLRLANMARDAGVKGFVTSSEECASVRALVGEESWIVVPGVRPAGTNPGDQKRIATPREAMTAGADLIVVGRPIRDADDPAGMARTIRDEIVAASPK